MQIGFRKLFTDKNSIEYSVVKTGSTQCLCLQSDRKKLARVKKAYLSSKCFYPASPENFFEALSVNEVVSQNLVNALFTHVESGFLADFLAVVPKEWYYATGKKLGRVLRNLHTVSLTEKQKAKAQSRHNKFMEHMATYISSLPHFKNDKYAIDAISSRYDNFKIFRSAMRYGSFKHQQIMITHDSTLLLLPSYTFGPGDICEDFAMLECESAGLYPILCAGVIDGYFSGVIPSKFWMHFALYSALYSLWKCGTKAKESKQMYIKMQMNSDRIREDFNNFLKPVPNWYTNPELAAIKEKAKTL